MGFSADEQSTAEGNAGSELFRANFGYTMWNNTRIGALKVSEVWLNASGGTVPSGNYYRVDPNQIRCITFPCPAQYHEAKLNSTVDNTLVGFFGPFADKLSAQPEPVLASGYNWLYRGKKYLEATQFWTRVKPSIPASLYCNSDADCTFSAYTHEISSASECYCTLCPNGLMNVSTEDRYRTSWETYCSGVRMMCPLPPCVNPGEAKCVNNSCTRSLAPL
jgi:hypothetical protein